MSEETDNDTVHGPGHAGCPTCDPRGVPPAAARRPSLSTVKVRARGEDFHIVQLQGQLFVCTKQNGSCCCGWAEKGRMPFDPSILWGQEWERRKIRNQVHLSFTGCLGPCAAGNNALLQLFGRSIWLKDLNDPSLAPAVFDYVEAMLAPGGFCRRPSDCATTSTSASCPRRRASTWRWLRTGRPTGAGSSGWTRCA